RGPPPPGCTAVSLRRRVPGRSAAPRSRVACLGASARRLMVAPPSRSGAALRVARLRLAPGSRASAPPLAGSWLHQRPLDRGELRLQPRDEPALVGRDDAAAAPHGLVGADRESAR